MDEITEVKLAENIHTPVSRIYIRTVGAVANMKSLNYNEFL